MRVRDESKQFLIVFCNFFCSFLLAQKRTKKGPRQKITPLLPEAAMWHMVQSGELHFIYIQRAKIDRTYY
jgi:hypothetical protein